MGVTRRSYRLYGKGLADQAYSWPTRKIAVSPFVAGFDGFTYFLEHFPAYHWFEADTLSEDVNLLVHRIMTVLNENKEFDDAVVQKIIRESKQEVKVNIGAVSKRNLVKTALFHIAFGVGILQMVKLFYKMRFQEFYDHEGLFAIHKAIKQGHLECCRLLLQLDNKNANLISRFGDTALSVACDIDAPHDMVRLLIENGADPNLCGSRIASKSTERDLPLLVAVSRGNDDLITLLLESGADLNMTSSKGETVLHVAARHDERAIFARFLELGVSLYALDNDGCSCLMAAVVRRSLPIVQRILEEANRSDRVLELVNGINRRDESVLMLAAASCNLEILRELYACGVDCNYINPEGKSAVSVALNFLSCMSTHGTGIPSRRERLVWIHEVLLRTSPEVVAQNMEFLMFLVARDNADELFPFILESEISLETRLNFQSTSSKRGGTTMLFKAVENGSKEVVDLLLTAGAKMIHPASLEQSPFARVFKCSPLDISIVECFLKHNVDLNFIRRNSAYNVPEALVSLLESYSDPLFLDVLQLLLRCGLDPSVKYWCSCGSGVSNARLRKRPKKHVLMDGLKDTQVANYKETVKRLLEFSPLVPPCLYEVLDRIDFTPEIPSLQHLCRLSYRKLISPSQLLRERWTETSNLPDRTKHYLSFGGPLP